MAATVEGVSPRASRASQRSAARNNEGSASDKPDGVAPPRETAQMGGLGTAGPLTPSRSRAGSAAMVVAAARAAAGAGAGDARRGANAPTPAVMISRENDALVRASKAGDTGMPARACAALAFATEFIRDCVDAAGIRELMKDLTQQQRCDWVNMVCALLLWRVHVHATLLTCPFSISQIDRNGSTP